jgi:predicted O-methyltransferase YrrM
MHSYDNTLYALLEAFNPKNVFEWGPGISTQIMALYPSVEKVVSVEHDEFFYDLVEKLKLDNVTLEIHQDMQEYVDAIGDSRYDLIFIDGRSRSNCLKVARNLTGLVVLHDAARLDYRDAVDDYKFQIWTDEGNTVVLTNSQEVYEKAKSALYVLECKKPNPEVIAIKKSALEKGYSV